MDEVTPGAEALNEAAAQTTETPVAEQAVQAEVPTEAHGAVPAEAPAEVPAETTEEPSTQEPPVQEENTAAASDAPVDPKSLSGHPEGYKGWDELANGGKTI